MSRILVVESDPNLADAIVQVLSASHFALDFARTGPELAAKLEASAPYDLVITDIEMPGGGSGLVDQVLAAPLAIALVVISTRPMHSMALVARRPGISGVLRKPFSASRLLRTVNAALLGHGLV